MAESNGLGTSFRGYDKDAVDRAVERLRNELATVEQNNEQLRAQVHELRDESAALESKNRQLTAKIRSIPENPSYANLGAQFEEALRSGEEQADRMLAEAKAEAELSRQTAQSRASRILREAEERAQKLLADTNARVDELRLTSESLAADITARANVKQAETSELLSTARRSAASRVAEAERKFAEQRSALQRNIEVERAALYEFAEETDRQRVAAEEALRLRGEQSELENMQRHQDAVERANRVISEANQRAREVSGRASEITAESELALSTAKAKADEMVRDARLLALGLINQATERAQQISEQTRQHVDALLDRMVARTERLREERERLDEYSSVVTDVRTSEMLIAQFEENVHSRSRDFGERGELGTHG